MLDSAPADTPPAAPQARNDPPRTTGRPANTPATKDRNTSQTQTQNSPEPDRPSAKAGRNSTKPADVPPREAKSAPPTAKESAKDKPATNAAGGTPAKTVETPTQAADAAAVEVIAQAVVGAPQADAVAAPDAKVKGGSASGKPDKAKGTSDDAAAPAKTDSGTDPVDPNAVQVQGQAQVQAQVQVQVQVQDQVPVAVPVAVAVTPPVAVNPAPTADPSVGPAGIAAVESPAIVPAASDGSTPVAPKADPTLVPQAADCNTQAPAAAKSPTAGATAAGPTPKDTPAVTAPQAADVKAPADPADATERKTTGRAEGKADGSATKVKPDQHGHIVHDDTAQRSPDTTPAPAATDAQPAKPPVAVRQPHPQVAEPTEITARQTKGDSRADVTTPSAPVQAGGNAPILNPTAPIALPLSTMFAVAPPRADTTADAAVPVAGLAIEIVARAQDGGKHFEIRLDPPELGRIDVRLNVEDSGKVTSHLVVERTETLDLLRRDQPQLERALQQARLSTDGGLQFSLRDQSFANRDQTPRDNTNTSQLIIPDDEAAAADAARRGYGRLIGLGSGVDIRV